MAIDFVAERAYQVYIYHKHCDGFRSAGLVLQLDDEGADEDYETQG